MDTFLRNTRQRPNSRNQTNSDAATTSTSTAPESTTSTTSGSGSTTSGNATTATDDESQRAIVITVNYVFSDQNRPEEPNRSGSLMMTLPNTAPNRDPRVIQEFVRLATQMAYSSIINGFNTERGTTLEKFKSFAGVKDTELSDNQTCSICFEKYEMEVDDEVVSHKKRRLFDETSQITSSSSNSRNNEQAQPSEQQPQDSQSRAPVFLMDYNGEFTHVPIKMPCSHIFGKDCLCEWLKKHTTCPLCRFSVAEEGVRRESPNATPDRNITIFNIPSETHGSNSLGEVTVQNNIGTRIVPPEEYIERASFFTFNPMESNNTPRPPTPAPPPGTNNNEPPLRRLFRSTRARREREERQARQEEEAREFMSPFSEIFDYVRRGTDATRNQRPSAVEPLFPFGMTSRRTANGIETTATDMVAPDQGDELNMRSLFDASPMPEARNQNDEENDTSSSSSSSNRSY
ncbi:SAN1 Protein SAN1 [Candida maltosa Xu316]